MIKLIHVLVIYREWGSTDIKGVGGLGLLLIDNQGFTFGNFTIESNRI